MAPITSTALDMALDTAAGGGMAVFSCGSGRKLKAAMSLALAPPQAPPLKHARRSLPHQSLAMGKPLREVWHVHNRYSSSLVPVKLSLACKSDMTRPYLNEHSRVPNPRSRQACEADECSWLSDPGAFLSSADQTDLQRLLDRVNLATGSQCALVVLANLHGSETNLAKFRTFGTSLFNAWGIGSATHNNGTLILLFHEARRLEIITGTGMSAALSDTWLADMQQRVMVPHLRAGNHPAALKAGILAIEQQLQISAPTKWRNDAPDAEESLVTLANTTESASSQLTSSFGGGQSQSHLSLPRPREDRNTYDMLPAWLMLGGLACLLQEQPLHSDELTKLEDQLSFLHGSKGFKNADGAHTPWPYQVPPQMMGLLDVTSQPLCTSHPFTLASSGQLAVKAHATSFGKRSLELTLHNISQEDVIMHLPVGSMFVPPSENNQQPLICKDAVFETLAPGEEKKVTLDTYCGDSSAAIPHGLTVLSPYVLQEVSLATQADVWRWSAKFRPHRVALRHPAADEFDTLRESFGMTRTVVEDLCKELHATGAKHHSQREERVASLRASIEKEQKRLTQVRHEERSRRSSSHGSSSSFGGGRSCGGGAGCSY